MNDKRLLPDESAPRKTFPMCSGLLDYFPDALSAVANVSWVGNEKHNPGEALHWARGKSMDHVDCIARHLTQRGGFETVKLPDGRVFKVRHSAALAWRALALCQEELEAEYGLTRPRGASDEEKIAALQVGQVSPLPQGAAPRSFIIPGSLPPMQTQRDEFAPHGGILGDDDNNRGC